MPILFIDILAISSKNITGDINGTIALSKAEAILKELQDRNFSIATNRSKMEKNASLSEVAYANTIIDEAMDLLEKMFKFNNTFKVFLEAFKNLKQVAVMSSADAANATILIKMAKTIDFQVQELLVT